MRAFRHSDFRRIWEAITEDQRQQLRDKAQWEHMSLSAVMLNWPSIIHPHVLSTIDPPARGPTGETERGEGER